MKTIKGFIAVLASLTVLASCEKDGDNIILSGFESSELVATTHQVVLSSENRNQVVLSLAWDNCHLTVNNPHMGVADGTLTTSLQVSSTPSFTTVIESVESHLSRAYTGTELNSVAKNIGLTPDVESTLYFRLKASIGNNLDPKYSQTTEVKVTPYSISMKELHVLDASKSNTLATLYSPTENGEYAGFMSATGWMNCWFSENDGTIWGNYAADGHAFEISDSGDAWNCWFPEPVGCYYVTVSTKDKEWTATHVPALTVSGAVSASMSYTSNSKTWKATVTTTTDNASIRIAGTGKQYNATTRDGGTPIDTPIAFAANGNTISLVAAAGDITIAKAGSYTLTLDFSNPAAWTYALVEGGGTVSYPEQLSMMDKDGANTLLSLHSPTKNGIYQGFYQATLWENFQWADQESNIWYGSDPANLYKLSTASDKNKIWFDEEGYFFLTANLADMNWSKKAVTQINVCGGSNNWSQTADKFTYDAVNKVWTVICTINVTKDGLYFLINGDAGGWDFYLKGNGDGKLAVNSGSNITISDSETGLYKIMLNLADLTYTMVKQ